MTTYCGYIALVGQPNVGKSTLINTFRGLARKAKTEDNSKNLAATDVVQCTDAVKEFEFNSEYNKVHLCDLPGAGTPEFKKDKSYLEKVKFFSYDIYLLISSEGFSETDDWLLNEIVKTKKPFAFIYSKIDSIIDGHIQSFDDLDDMSEDDIQLEKTIKMDLIRSECSKRIEKLLGPYSYKLFLMNIVLMA
jgi:small GTP-binding protein